MNIKPLHEKIRNAMEPQKCKIIKYVHYHWIRHARKPHLHAFIYFGDMSFFSMF